MECKRTKKILSVILFLMLGSSVFAQMSADPTHSFYADAQKWESYGLIESLPPIRPYPFNVIRKILQTVIVSGDEKESAVAEEYFEELTGKPFNFAVETGVTLKASDKTSFAGVFFPKVYGDLGLFNDLVGIGYKVGFAGYTETAKDYLNNYVPMFSFLTHDTLQDPGEIWKFKFYLDTNDVVSVGNTNIYVQLGISRLGYGSFLSDGLALNDNAYHMPNITFTVIQPRWNYSQLYAALGATKNYDGSGLMANKYLAFHQFEFKINKKMSLAYYENMIFGKRFDFSYIIPAPYMAIQGIGGCDDNLQMGLKFNFKPVNGLLWATDLFVDDVNFNDLVKFKFDTKLRIAAATGVIYNPKNSIFSNISLKYTLVTPYTYSHWQYTDDVAQTIYPDTYNYQSYTNNGYSIGSTLPPNSDQIKASFDLKPVKNLKLTVNLGFARHGNSAETLPTSEALYYILDKNANAYATDGSINQHVIIGTNNDLVTDGNGDYLDSAWNHLNFLNQEHKMYIFLGGVNASYTVGKWKWGSLALKASYNAEYIVNKGVDSNLYPSALTTYDATTKTYTYNGVTYTSADDLVAAYKADWTSTFTNVFNNYFYVGIEYKW